MTTRTLSLLGIAVIALAALTGCSTAGGPSATGDSSASATAGQTVTIEDAWVKAADAGMSAAFGELENPGDEDITVVSAESAASSMLELHETVENEAGEMIMRPKDGGFTIPAGGRMTLEPGGNHIMLMDLVQPIVAGDEITFTLTFSDDSTFEFTAPAKDFSGANETYEGGDEMDMGGEG